MSADHDPSAERQIPHHDPVVNHPESYYPFILDAALHLPKWFFSLVISLFSGPGDDKRWSGESNQDVINTRKPTQFDHAENVSQSAQITTESFFQGLISSLFSNFPAKLIVGRLEHDMNVVSVVLLSAFTACLTSIFVIYLYSSSSPSSADLSGIISGPLPKQGAFQDPFRNPDDHVSKTGNEISDDTMRRRIKIIPDLEHGNRADDCKKSKDCSENLVILHQFPRGKYTPCFDMEGMKVETLLRLARIPHEVLLDCDNTGPWIQLGELTVWGSRSIINFLKKHFPTQINLLLVPQECRIQAHFINLHVENELCWLLYHWRWFYGINCREDNFAWSKIPQEYVELAASSWNRKLGDVPIDSLLEYLEDAMGILSHVLGKRSWFVTARPSLVDVTVFAALAQACWGMPATTAEGLIRGKRNLLDFSERMRQLCWADWENHLQTEQTNKVVVTTTADMSDDKGMQMDPSETEPQARRSRTRRFSKSRVPFYSPPEIFECSGAGRIEKLEQTARTEEAHCGASQITCPPHSHGLDFEGSKAAAPKEPISTELVDKRREKYPSFQVKSGDPDSRSIKRSHTEQVRATAEKHGDWDSLTD